MPRLPRKSWTLETRIKTAVALREQAKFNQSTLGLQSALVRMIDRVDPMEVAAVGATAIVIKDLIDETPDFLNKVSENLAHPSSEAVVQASIASSGILSAVGLTFPDRIEALKSWILSEYNRLVEQAGRLKFTP